MEFIETMKALSAFQGKHRGVAAMIWFYSLMAAGVIFFPRRMEDWPFLFMAWASVAYLALYLLERYDTALIGRMEAGDGGLSWQVNVDGRNVGTISDATYAAIRRRVFLDARTYGAQLINLAHGLNRAINELFWAIPAVVFWCVLACLWLAPDTFVSILVDFQKETPAQMESFTHNILLLLVIYAVALIFTRLTFGNDYFGVANHFAQAANNGLRVAIGDPAGTGHLYLYRMEGDNIVFPREWAHVQHQKKD